MARQSSTKSKAIQAAAFVVALLLLLLPAVAWAGWGEENWGEMIWAGGFPAVPSLSVPGQVALVILSLALPAGLLLRHRRRATR